MTTFKKLLALAALMLIAVALVAPRTTSAAGQNGTTLSADKTAAGHWTITTTWTIDKSVAPSTLDMFRGDSGTVNYTIAVDKTVTEAIFVDGEVCVTNGGGVATENLTIWDDVLYKTGSGSFTVLLSAPVDTSGNPVLDPGESDCYAYSIPFTPVEGAIYKNSVRVTITNHSGHLGEQYGPSPDADFSLPGTPELLGPSAINVDDSNGGSWAFTDDGSADYSKTFTCDADAGSHGNTATIRETGQSDDASVQVNCYALGVTKDAATTWTRDWTWTIDKSADQSSLTLAKGQTFLVNYTVAVGASHTDSAFAVSGNISVHNPAPIAAVINSVSDVISGIGAVTPNCGAAFPYTLGAGQTLACAYTSALPNTDGRTNTATATLQNTPAGTTDFSGSAAVAFGDPTTETDECVNVSDDVAGPLGTLCRGGSTFTYSRTIGPYDTCGSYQLPNTASFVANDSGAASSDSWTVNVTVPCGGCTRTIGYWKTHAGFTGNNADVLSQYLPIWLGASGGAKSVQVTSAAQAVFLLEMSGEASNGINKLYAQLLGARLNIAAGADGSAAAGTISAADAWLATHNAADWSSLSKKERNQVLAWMTTLDNYNNGLIGPGHCSE
jgi:hypothetical protein